MSKDTARNAYDALSKRFEQISVLNGCSAILGWDYKAGIMPHGSAPERNKQLATLAVIAHEKLTDPEIGDLLHKAEEPGMDYDTWEAANLAEMRRKYIHATALDADLVARFSNTCSECEQLWEDARPNNDFAAVKSKLNEQLELVREIGAAKGEALGLSPYDAMVDQFSRGLRARDFDRLFGELEDFLPGFIPEVVERQNSEDAPLPLKGPFPVHKQARLGRRIAEVIGFDFNRGRLDTSAHPFSGGVPDDKRMTTRYNEDNVLDAIQGVVHETGHAMYDFGTPAKWRHQPVGEDSGMAVHETQSLIVERQACLSREFFEFAAPIFCEILDVSGPEWSAENLYRLSTRVNPDFIRVEADEATYPLHVILRYRLEQAMIAGDLAIDDLPGAWNEGMEKYLGITPPDDRRGCLQDIHWYDGAWGYFPAYSWGAMGASQLYDAAVAKDPAIKSNLRNGDFKPLMDWLEANLHGMGCLMKSDGLIENATGKPLGTDSFINHLKRRYIEERDAVAA